MYKYKDSVEIKSGFYRGCKGKVIIIGHLQGRCIIELSDGREVGVKLTNITKAGK